MEIVESQKPGSKHSNALLDVITLHPNYLADKENMYGFLQPHAKQFIDIIENAGGEITRGDLLTAAQETVITVQSMMKLFNFHATHLKRFNYINIKKVLKEKPVKLPKKTKKQLAEEVAANQEDVALA
jgi:hypothetical protein